MAGVPEPSKLLARLRLRFSGSTLSEQLPPADGSILAAVLVPLVDSPDGPIIVLTRRAHELSTHGGEISFPGGRVDPDEDEKAAALREAREELGIDAGQVEVIGPLPRVSTVLSGYTIAPWIGAIPQRALADLRPNPLEIAEVITVPVEALLSPGARRDQRFIRGGAISLSPAYDVGSITIWGATARILAGLLDAADGSAG